ncbi:hypothetical protein ACFE04_012860 [Oxalis oulophora]
MEGKSVKYILVAYLIVGYCMMIEECSADKRDDCYRKCLVFCLKTFNPFPDCAVLCLRECRGTVLSAPGCVQRTCANIINTKGDFDEEKMEGCVNSCTTRS